MSTLYKKIKAGLTVMRLNNRLLFVGVLVFLFPILFVAIVQNFYTTAYTNIETSEKRQVALLHDALALLLYEYPMNSNQIKNFIESQKQQSSDITEIRIVEKNSAGFLILESYAPEIIGSYEQNLDLYQSTISLGNASLIFEFHNDSFRTWHAVRSVAVRDTTTYYIFTEHSFKTIDAVMATRQQQSYVGLTAIFIFLICLAYWCARQVDWRKQYCLLEENLKQRDLFTHMIAHEFRTPLTAVRGYASFLEESTTLSSDERKFVDVIQVSSNRMLTLVNDFLEVARIQSDKTNIQTTQTDIQPVIKSVLEVLLPLAKEKNLQLIHTSLAVPVVLNTDSKRLYQVLVNLISNSIKYTPSGIIEITTNTTPLSVSITIKDTGMGITSEDLQKLFTPFARVGEVEKSTIVGTGLGMWITKQYVELLRGTISVESIKDVGTHVTLTFKRQS